MTELMERLHLRSLTPHVILPDGNEFLTWEPIEAPRYTKTYHVDCRHPAAVDDGPGTEKCPFKTINAAAQIVEPGERVLIHAGVYRERVSPARGGDGPEAMIHYEAAPGENVVIKGSEIVSSEWTLSHIASANGGDIWTVALDPGWFEDGYNPFVIPNVTPKQFEQMDWTHPERGNPVFSLPRGLVFQDGRRLKQVVEARDLTLENGSYWVDGARLELHVRPFDGVEPSAAGFEITVRETVFAPRVENLGFICVKGLTLEHAAGAWPFPQLGALSTMRGHHWIIEENIVRQVNAVGIDLGRQKLEDYDRVYGFHIARRNRISDCGICGINGFGPGDGDVQFGLLVEQNITERIGFHDAENLHECGGIKLHCNNRCLIRRNLILDTLRGPGIWVDAYNGYTRCCENVIINSTGRCGLFFEISFKPNLIDSNIIWSATECGILEADGHGQTYAHNFIGQCREGIELRGRQTDRVTDEQCGGHNVYNNVVVDCETPILEKSIVPSRLSGNLVASVTAWLDRDAMTLSWMAEAGPANYGVAIPERTHDILGQPLPAGNTVAGPFATMPGTMTTVDLAAIVGSRIHGAGNELSQ